MQQHPSDDARNAQQRALLILDIDETLIHATGNPLPDRRPDFTFGPYAIYCRPHLQDFLTACAQHYDLAVWSSGGCEYVAAIVEQIFPDFIRPAFVWSRQRCTSWTDPETRDTCFLKDLRKVKQKGFDLRRVLIVEDTPGNVRRLRELVDRRRSRSGASDPGRLLGLHLGGRGFSLAGEAGLAAEGEGCSSVIEPQWWR